MAIDEQALLRIDELEAKLNGIIIYLAAKETDVTLDPDDASTKQFLRDNVSRQIDTRLNKTLPRACDGYWDSYALGKIPELAEKLRNRS
jgi:hypothetical protein